MVVDVEQLTEQLVEARSESGVHKPDFGCISSKFLPLVSGTKMMQNKSPRKEITA